MDSARAKRLNILDHTLKWRGLKQSEEREGGVGADQNACTRSCVEGYWGKIGAKTQFLPQNHPENHPKIHPDKSGGGLGCVTVSQLSDIP